MTELMKRYEAETDEIATWCWHNKHIVTDDVLDWAWWKIRALEAENEKLREDASEVFIREMSMKNGSFDATFESGIGPVIATYIAKMLESHHARNFVTTLMASTSGIEGEKYYMTMGRCNGKNVEEKYHEVISENSLLKAQLTWRPVSGGLPERQGGFFVRTPHSFPKNIPYQVAEFYDDNKTFYEEHTDSPLNDVTHWLPIPPAPEGEVK